MILAFCTLVVLAQTPVNIRQVGDVSVGTTVPVSGIVTSAIAQASFTDRSGFVATGGTSQTLTIINASRKRIVIENPCSITTQNIAATENLFLNFTSAASTTSGSSIELLPCGSYDSGPGPVTTELITVNAATTGHQYTAKEQ